MWVSKVAEWSSRTDSLKHKNGPLQCAIGQLLVADSQYWWTGHFQHSSNKKGSIQKEKAVVTWEELGINALVCGEGAKVRAHLVVIQTGNVEINSNVNFYVYWWPRKVWDPQFSGTGVLEGNKIHLYFYYSKKKNVEFILEMKKYLILAD